MRLSARQWKYIGSWGADFICFDSIIVEIKAWACLGKMEEAQIIN